MDPLPDPVGETLHALAVEVKNAERLTPNQDELVDFVGTLGAYIRRLETLRRRHLSEIDGPTQGVAYKATTSRTAKRTYNTNGILAAAKNAHPDSDPLLMLLGADAVRLAWRWTALEAFCNAFDVPLTKVFHEIGDGDPDAMVGEVWETKTRIEGLD